MSIFHNDVSGERLALGWHCLGVFVSSAICIIAFVSGWLLVAIPAAVEIPVLQHWLACVFFGDSIIGFCGLLWHVWATRQHIEALRSLRQPKDYSCR